MCRDAPQGVFCFGVIASASLHNGKDAPQGVSTQGILKWTWITMMHRLGES